MNKIRELYNKAAKEILPNIQYHNEEDKGFVVFASTEHYRLCTISTFDGLSSGNIIFSYKDPKDGLAIEHLCPNGTSYVVAAFVEADKDGISYIRSCNVKDYIKIYSNDEEFKTLVGVADLLLEKLNTLEDDLDNIEKAIEFYASGYAESAPTFITKDSPTEKVDHPSHYNNGKIEVIDFIDDHKLNFERGNAVKYVCRAGLKDKNKEIEDLNKAIWYIQREIQNLEKEKNN